MSSSQNERTLGGRHTQGPARGEREQEAGVKTRESRANVLFECAQKIL